MGCLVVDGVRETTASVEVCRTQLWQWLRHGASTGDGRTVTPERVDCLLMRELDRIHDEVGATRLTDGVFPSAARLFERMIKQERFEEFLTVPAYELLG